MPRDSRQKELIPPEKLNRTHAMVVGVGAVGRQVSLQLAAMGVPKLTLIDFDKVEDVNFGPQGYHPDHLGQDKVSSTAQDCRKINPDCQIETVSDRFRVGSLKLFDSQFDPVLFACVDDMDARGAIWNAAKSVVKWFADSRMAAEVVRVITSIQPARDDYYPKTLFSAAEAYQGSCTAKSTIYSASVAAAMMIAQLTKWFRCLPVERDVNLNLLTMELGVEQD